MSSEAVATERVRPISSRKMLRVATETGRFDVGASSWLTLSWWKSFATPQICANSRCFVEQVTTICRRTGGGGATGRNRLHQQEWRLESAQPAETAAEWLGIRFQSSPLLVNAQWRCDDTVCPAIQSIELRHKGNNAGKPGSPQATNKESAGSTPARLSRLGRKGGGSIP